MSPSRGDYEDAFAAAAFTVFVLGIVGTGMLAVPVLAGSAAYAVGEAFHWRVGLAQRPGHAPAFYATIAAATLVGAWTSENRGRYDRSRLRYPSDLTDEEWALVEPLIAPAKRDGAKRTVDVREVVNGLMYILSTAANRAPSRRTCLRAPRSTIISICGAGMGRGIASKTRFTCAVARRPRARPPPSSTARAFKSGEKGGLDRSGGLRRGQENQGQEAPRSCRYPRAC